MRLWFTWSINQLVIYINKLSTVYLTMNVQIFQNLPTMKSESLLVFVWGMLIAQAIITKQKIDLVFWGASCSLHLVSIPLIWYSEEPGIRTQFSPYQCLKPQSMSPWVANSQAGLNIHLLLGYFPVILKCLSLSEEETCVTSETQWEQAVRERPVQWHFPTVLSHTEALTPWGRSEGWLPLETLLLAILKSSFFAALECCCFFPSSHSPCTHDDWI